MSEPAATDATISPGSRTETATINPGAPAPDQHEPAELRSAGAFTINLGAPAPDAAAASLDLPASRRDRVRAGVERPPEHR